MTETLTHKNTVLISMAMAMTGFALWTVCDASVRYLKDYPVVLIAFVSSFFSLVFLLVFSGRLGGLRETLRRPRLGLRLLRGAFIAGSNFLSYLVFTHLDLASAYAIIFVAPLIAKIISIILMGEKIGPQSWLITLLGFSGVLIALRPGWIPLNIGTASALSLTFFFSLGYILSRYIGEENQTPLSLVLFQTVFVTVVVAGPAYSAYKNVDLTPLFFLLTLLMSVVGLTGSLLVAKAYTHGPAAYIAPIQYTQIIWGLLFGVFLFHEYPDLWTLVGAAIIILAGLLLVRFSRVERGLLPVESQKPG